MEKKSARNQTVRQPQPPHIKKRPVGGSAVSGPSFGALVLEAGAMHCGSVNPDGSMKVGGSTRTNDGAVCAPGVARVAVLARDVRGLTSK